MAFLLPKNKVKAPSKKCNKAGRLWFGAKFPEAQRRLLSANEAT
jgi:hypothetical protein